MTKKPDSTIWGPYLVEEKSLQRAWATASGLILEKGGQVHNLTVRISDVNSFDRAIDRAYESFCHTNGILTAKHVAYTIFPAGLARHKNAEGVFELYNRANGVFDRIKKGWGTYFRRFSNYERSGKYINQLGRIIAALCRDKRTMTAAYTMIVQEPGPETTLPRGGPCLNYIAFQVEGNNPREIGLLAVYRNHDFLHKAYGNYVGLSQLLAFVNKEVGTTVGPLTVVSSHAYIERKKIMEGLLGSIR